MNRFYTKEDVLKIIKEFKKQIPNITISTDIIVGFPGETNKDFQETLDLIKKIKPEILNRSNFGKRPGTPAEKLKSISSKKMKQRAKKLMVLHLKICKENQKPWIGKKVKILIDKKGFENTWLGRAENYKLFAVHSRQNILGKFVNVKVKKLLPHYLISELTEK